MTNEEIKEDCLRQFDLIKIAQERLIELRNICKHEHTFEGNYSWRLGSIVKAEICSYCTQFIKAVE
jgi:hypothetical protein